MNRYQTLKQYQQTGQFARFRTTYFLAPPSDEERLLAIKVFKEVGEWSTLFEIVEDLQQSQEAIFQIKGKLYATFFDFLLRWQSRQRAMQVTTDCQKISQQYKGKELDLFAQRIGWLTQMAMLTLGLADAATKRTVIETAVQDYEFGRTIHFEEAIALLEAAIGNTLGLPVSEPNFALQLLQKYTPVVATDSIPEPHHYPFYLLYAKALLLSQYQNRKQLTTPATLPPLLLQIEQGFSNTQYEVGIPLLYNIYGTHLLKLEYLEGVEWLEKSLQPLWELGYVKMAHDTKKDLVNWMEQRGFIAEVELVKEKYTDIEKAEEAPFEQNLQKLYQAHQWFSEGAYGDSQQLMKEATAHQESETFQVAFISLLVNSTMKIQGDHQSLLWLLDQQILQFQKLKNSALLAQLYAFKTQLKGKSDATSYARAISLHDQLGLTNEAVTYRINRAYDAVMQRRRQNQQPLLDETVISLFRQADQYLQATPWVEQRHSLEATLFQRWGIALTLAGEIKKATECFQRAGELMLEANHLFQYALNCHHLASNYIQQSRNAQNLSFYDQAAVQLQMGIEVLAKSNVIDFYWRLCFNKAIALSEPLKYGLVPNADQHQKRLAEAEEYYTEAIEVFGLLLKRNQTDNQADTLLIYGQLNRDIRQLIFAGFYCFFFEQQWEKCLFWLERVRAKTLLRAIAEKINPNIKLVKHELIAEERQLKKRLTEAPTILQKQTVEASLAQLYKKMRQEEHLRLYAEKKQVFLPTYQEIKKGLRVEEKSIGRNVVLLYYYTHNEEIYLFTIRSQADQIHFERVKGIEVSTLKQTLQYTYPLYLKSYDRTTPNPDFWLKYSLLVTPIQKWTQEGDILCIIPYGFLHDLPFHALLLDGEPLIKRHPIFYNASWSTWEYLRTKTTQSLWSKPTIFANPALDLKYALQEANLIGDLLEVRPLLEAEVSKEHFLEALSSSSLLHFAGHGFFDNQAGMASGIHLYKKQVVSVKEIMNQTSSSNLVVLSACDTGMHRNHPGEERAGWTTALLSAGVSSVITSLWSVTDHDANRFFSIFYPKLKEGKPKVIALQESMIEAMSFPDRSAFYYWGAFALHGNGC